jgi:hypothetical protein
MEVYKNGVYHHTMLEIVWTTIPAIILAIIAVPSFALLYSMEEFVEPSLSVKVTGHQWYWCYEYSNCKEPGLGNFVFDVSFVEIPIVCFVLLVCVCTICYSLCTSIICLRVLFSSRYFVFFIFICCLEGVLSFLYCYSQTEAVLFFYVHVPYISTSFANI